METTKNNYIVTFKQMVYNDDTCDELLDVTFNVLACFTEKKEAIEYAEKFYETSSQNAWKKSYENKNGKFEYHLGDKNIINDSVYYTNIDVVMKQTNVAKDIEDDIQSIFQ